MAFKNVNNLITDLNRKVSPGNTSKSRDIFGSIAEGTRAFLEDLRPKELSRRVLIENALYDQVKQFTCPEDLDEKKIMQWYKLGSHSNQTGQSNVDTWFYPMKQVTNREFDSRYQRCSQKEFTIEWQSGVKFIKVSDFQHAGGVTIHNMDSLTDNGFWNTFGNAVNLTEDHLTYITGNGSIRFDLNTSSNSGGIINFNMTPVDLSDFFVVGKIFTWLDLPNLNQLQTVTMDLLTDASNINSNYYSITVNSPHDAPYFQVGQNLLGFIFDNQSMNTVGTPDPKNVIGVRLTFNTNATLLMNNIRVDNIVARKGSVFGIQYISRYAFNDAQTGLWKQSPTEVSDIIHLEPATYNVLLAYCAVNLAQEIFSGTQGQTDLAYLEGKRKEALATYKRNNKTEFIEEQQFLAMSTANYGYPYYWNGRANDSHTNTAPPPTQ